MLFCYLSPSSESCDWYLDQVGSPPRLVQAPSGSPPALAVEYLDIIQGVGVRPGPGVHGTLVGVPRIPGIQKLLLNFSRALQWAAL